MKTKPKMALSIRAVYRNSSYVINITKQSKWYIGKTTHLRTITSGICYSNNNCRLVTLQEVKNKNKEPVFIAYRQIRTQPNNDDQSSHTPEPKVGLVQKFKQMYRDYWYVLLPVHMTTSAIWIGSFYYAVRSGLDVIGILESMNISDKWLDPLRESRAGYFALALACYKLVTPLRYAVTVGGTTYAIRKLTAFGLIKPVPTKQRIKEMIKEQKGNIQDRYYESKCQMKSKRVQVMDEMRRYKTEMRELKDKIKKL